MSDPTWSSQFDAYLNESGMTTRIAAATFGACPSQIFAWRRGSEPREERKLAVIEKRTRGRVRASLARKGRGRARRAAKAA